MKQEQKIWIEGNCERGNEVIAKLESLGGENIREYTGAGEDLIYYIRPRGYIDWVGEGSEMCELVQDNYVEYKLPKKYSFKPFDKVLARTDSGIWIPSMYAFENAEEFHFVGGTYVKKSDYQVIPFNKDTEHLIGTKDEYNE